MIESTKNILNTNQITTLELVEQINFFRSEQKLKSPKNRLYSNITHDSLIKIIRDEFEEEIRLGEVNDTPYIHPQNGQKYTLFNLTISQAKQVLVRESKVVRKAVIKHLENLENKVELAPANTSLYRNPATMGVLEWIDFAKDLEIKRQQTERDLQTANLKLEHKQSIILDLTQDIPVKTMRAKINEVIRYVRFGYGDRWNKLYREFKYHYNIDIPTRADHRGMAKLDYAQQEGLLQNLYKLALELFEKDNPELKYNQKQLQTEKLLELDYAN
jgi:hypothetical protein